ncbi:OPT oligopeptide transporter protein-domain-containing protein [Tricharina praecox]|uniref:OPT oligopeptide transporter protein-domain-containing protein n=1 Tax=Tricharina praecox TaxID=43433 RepID=UPI00221F4FAB|nr:OPT oligopeptide transporter protein-domain-containing protein [Tricharina praecox]KAI5845939.1 OPT oligopeptide transporter protein-domain-containing protein [Tricharina praecox]
MDPVRPQTPPPPLEGVSLTEHVPSYDEKKDFHNVGIDSDENKSVHEIESDPFVPFPDDPNMPREAHSQILTIRAVVTGCILGGLVNASNVYLGLRTGWTFPANLFGTIFGFAFLKFCSRTFGENFPILGGSFGPKENAIVQTAATAAGGLGGIFVSAIPALYQMDLLGDPVSDFPRLLTFTIVSAYYGLLFATPLRKFFIIHVARELNLIFPTATAAAMTIRSMHSIGGDSNVNAMKRTRALGITFAVCLAFRVGASYAPGILWDWHIFSWFFEWSNYSNAALAIENWGWFIEWTPAFIGSGMLVGLNPAISFFGGGVLAWGIIGPALVHNGAAYGVSLFSPEEPQYEHWGGLVSFNSFNLKDPKNMPSPRYWLLWPGVLLMICASFAELGVQYKLLGFAMKSVWKAIAGGTNFLATKMGKPSVFLDKQANSESDMVDQDPAAEEDQVKLWQWGPSLILVIIATCIVLGLQYQLNVGLSILAILLGFIFAFLAIQCTGATDTTPLTAAAKATQLVLGAATQSHPILIAQRMNLVGGAIASGAASQSTDLVVDYRVGFLLKTPPKLQWYAQIVGSIVAMFLSPGMFILFMKAYPCVIDLTAETCSFQAPSVAAWRAVAIAVTDPTFPVPNSSGIFAIVLGLFSIIVVIFRHNYLAGERAKYRKFVPNFMAVGLAFVLPATQYGTAMLMGSIVAVIWAKRNPVAFDIFCYAVAAGMIAGEGLGGVVNAVLEIAGIGSSVYASPAGCPGGMVC